VGVEQRDGGGTGRRRIGGVGRRHMIGRILLGVWKRFVRLRLRLISVALSS
jgi:hypothetical protein